MKVVGSREALTVSNSSGDKSVLLIVSIDAPESTINFLSSGLMVEVDAIAHCIFGLKNVSSFPRYVPRFFYNLLAHCRAAFRNALRHKATLWPHILLPDVMLMGLLRCELQHILFAHI